MFSTSRQTTSNAEKGRNPETDYGGSPHTYALKVLFPRYADATFDVRPYFELIRLAPRNGTRAVTLHDPCFYGRYLEMSDEPRAALCHLGIECVNIRNSSAFTGCCGGLAESENLEKPKKIAIANQRLKWLYEEFEQAAIRCERRHFEA